MFWNKNERSAATKYYPVSLKGNRLIEQHQKRSLFSDIQYYFRSSDLTGDLLAVVGDINVAAFNISGTTWAKAFGIYKVFDRLWHSGLFYKLSVMDFVARFLDVFLHFSVISCFIWLDTLKEIKFAKQTQKIKHCWVS